MPSLKMSKFESYDLYMQNKEFLVSDGVITFTDTDGTLMALKPDVTLSIVKNYRAHQPLQKVCYNENVYRIGGASKSYREIPRPVWSASATSDRMSFARFCCWRRRA